MVNGTLGILKNIWTLVDQVATYLESDSIKIPVQSVKNDEWNNEFYKCRNSQLSMVKNSK